MFVKIFIKFHCFKKSAKHSGDKMKKFIFLAALLFTAQMFVVTSAQEKWPLDYNKENTGADCPVPYMTILEKLPLVKNLPDPFEWADGRGRIKFYSDWRIKREQIGTQIQYFEIGEKPSRPDTITANYSKSDSVLTVNVTVNGHTLKLTSKVNLPSGTGPFPVMIGMNIPVKFLIPASILKSRNIITMKFDANQVTSYWKPSNSDPYYKLYPRLNLDNTGQYSAWSWGVSRIIDGLELVKKMLPVDLNHIGVVGCSYSGKMALFAGAFDERIALTIALESGGGGATSWRYSHTEPAGTVEDVDRTNYNWFRNDMRQFSGNNVYYMPEDHHELMAMVAPRALYTTGNTDYTWLSNKSCYVACKAAKKVYDALGIPDRFGFSIVGGHMHCRVPDSQVTEIQAFIDRFLFNKKTVKTSGISDSPFNFDLSQWITWTNPVFTKGTTYYTDLDYPANYQTDLDTMIITFKWKKLKQAEMYHFELSSDPSFVKVDKDFSTTDTTKTFKNFIQGKRYFWRVQVKTAEGLGLWSSEWSFVTKRRPFIFRRK